MANSRRSAKGFTLAEIAAMLLVFSIFSTGLLACLTLSLRYYNKMNDRLTAEQNSRIIMSAIASEFRQCFPATSIYSDALGGVPAFSPSLGLPALGTTNNTILAILHPLQNNTDNSSSSNSQGLIFCEPNVNSPTFTVGGNTPDNYQLVQYRVNNSTGTAVMQRSVWTFNSSGAASGPVTANLAQSQNPPSGSTGIVFSVTATAPMTASITLTCFEGNFTYEVSCSTVSGVTF